MLAHTEADWLQPPVFPDSLLCSFPQVPLFVPVSFTIICLFTVAMSFYSDPVSISIGCTMVLSGFPVYYLIIHRQMSDRCRNLFCKYALKFQYCGPRQAQGWFCSGLFPELISNANGSLTKRPHETKIMTPGTPPMSFPMHSLHGQICFNKDKAEVYQQGEQRGLLSHPIHGSY